MRALQLPVFPWDTLAHAQSVCAQHPDGVIDLSVGSPVDPVPTCAKEALQGAWDAHSYPPVVGSPALQEAMVAWCRTHLKAQAVDAACVLPTIGSKEGVANLGWQLGLRCDDVVLFPDVAYPTYDICARVAGATGVAVDSENVSTWPEKAALVWINTPSNPTGHVLSVSQLRDIVSWARTCGAIVVSDECYAPLVFEEPALSEGVPSLLSDAVCDGDMTNLLVLFSASKQSNLAGYRASFIAGDPRLIAQLTNVRKHCGFMAPAPTLAALEAVLVDTRHVDEQVAIYARRRAVLKPALEQAGLYIDPKCVAGLYLWARARTENDPTPGATAGQDTGNKAAHLGELNPHPDDTQVATATGTSGAGRVSPSEICEKNPDGRDIVNRLAQLGILVAPGEFYGHDCKNWVRIALSETDANISAAAKRILEIKTLF